MKLTPDNTVRQCQVIDGDTGAALPRVASISTDSREVVQYEKPLRVIGGILAPMVRRFETEIAYYAPCGRVSKIELYGLQK